MMMGGGCHSEITPVMWWRVSVDDDGGVGAVQRLPQ